MEGPLLQPSSSSHKLNYHIGHMEEERDALAEVPDITSPHFNQDVF